MQDHPGAPGTARQESTRTTVSTNDGGTATQPRAPGHDRPHAALRAARHGRLSAATRAPGADVPPAITAGAPGQHRLRAALLAPGHDRPCAALRAAWHGRPRAATRAPGADVPPAIPAEAPGQYCLRAVAIATVALPAGQHRLRQEDLPHTPATPNTLTYPLSDQDTTPTRTVYHLTTRFAQSHESRNTPLSKCWRGAGGEDCNLFPPSAGGPLLSTQVHPATQVPPHPRSCSAAATGRRRQHPARAPPAPCASLRRKPQSSRTNE